MRIDSMPVSGQGGLTVRTGTGSFAASLKEGDIVQAEVLSSDKGAVVMKTDDGQTFRAKLDSDVTLSPGDQVLLEMVGKEAGIAFLSIREERPHVGENAEQSGSTQGFEDKTLLPYANKLAEMNIQVTEESARLVRELTVQYPGMTLEEAAFIASNKLAGDENLIKAALSILSDGEKTDVMLERLVAMLQDAMPDTPKPVGDAALGIPNNTEPGQIIENPDIGQAAISTPTPVGDAALGIPNSTEPGQTIENPDIGQATISTPTPVGDAALGIPNNTEPGQTIENPDIGQATISTPKPVGDAALGIPNNTEPGQTIENPDIGQATISTPKPVGDAALGIPGNSEFTGGAPQPATLTEWLTNIVERIIPQSDNMVQSKISEPQNPDIPPGGGDNESVVMGNKGKIGNVEAANVTQTQIEKAGKEIAELLSQIPEFQGTPAPALERFSNMLLKVAGDNRNVPNNDVEKLTDLVNKLFTRIEKNDNDAGLRLKSAKEELFARLALIEEMISRAGSSTKTPMLEQTRRLMDHVRVLNNIDQFGYMQIPVQIGEERRTAELYLFKKKAGKRLDPENVNILLALDLENMGHWEGLINFRNKDVSIKMEVPGPEEKEYFSENTVLLHELLASAGFKLVNTDITHSGYGTTPLTALSEFDRLTRSRTGSIDYRI